MGHHHDHHHHHHSDNAKNLGLAFLLNLAFTIIEIFGGLFTNSVSIISDAIHDLGDSLSLGLAWYLQKVSNKGRSPVYTFGYKRFSLLGAILTCFILIIGSIIILYKAIPRVIYPEEAHTPGMMALAVLGILVNGAAVLRLKGGTSLNEEAAYWHLLEDVLGWVVVLIGAIIMYFFGLPWLDPVLSIAITLYILFNVVKRLIKAFRIILQRVPEGLSIEKVEHCLKDKVEGLLDVHHVHIWSLDGEHHMASLHAKVADQTPVSALEPLKKQIRKILHDELQIEHLTIEFEGTGDCSHPAC
ncbi:MAG: cation diffusion facilitator family transporter [Bacteroidota bacterium]